MPTADSVLVVGAGPAGATAARRLALAGVRVRMLDRTAFPRNKPCGGAISARALSRFPYLGPALDRIATHAVSRLYLEGPDGHSTLIESDQPAVLLIRRYEFDRRLVELAVDAGAELIEGADVVQASESSDRVAVTTRDGRRFESPVVVAADGIHSVVARRLGLNAGWPPGAVALDMMEEAPRSALRDIDPSTLWVSYGFDPAAADGRVRRFEGRRAAEGYAYVFPKRDHVNVGIGYVLRHFRQSVDAAPYELQRGFVERLRRLGVLAGESKRRHFTPYLLPVGGPLRQPARGRVMLAGDAGGFVNGFTAEGIYYAMVTGEIAADTVLDTPAASIGRLAQRYAARCHREVGVELRDSVLLQQSLFADRRRIAAVIEMAPRRPALTALLLDYAIGRRDYKAVRRRVIWRLPSVALRLGCSWLWNKTCRGAGRGPRI